MSTGRYSTIGFIEESTYGTTPSAQLQLMNVKSIQYRRPRTLNRPGILTNDRRPFKKRVLEESGGLVLPTIRQFGNSTLLMEGLLANDEGSAVTVTASTISIVGATGVISDSGSGFGSFADGDLVYITGCTDSTNNGWKGPVTSAAAGSITVPAGQVNDESAGTSITIATQRHTDANTPRSYSGEYEATDISNHFRQNTGNRVAKVTWNWQAGGYVEESWELMGQAPAKGSSTIGTGANLAAPTSGYMNAVQDFGTIYIADSATTLIVTKLSIVVMAALGPVKGLGSLGPSEISTGGLDIEVTMDCYMDSAAVSFLGDIESQATKTMFWDIVDPQGNREAFLLPALSLDDGEETVSGPDDQKMLSNIKMSGHDPAKDPDCAYTSDIAFMFGHFKKAA